MKVALYARVSTEKQIENYSIPVQKERIYALCKSKGWTDVVEYIDGGYSGANLNRPALNKLQEDIGQGLINAVVVYRLDRLSRSQRDTLYLIEEKFLPHHVEFISITETIDTSTAFGRAMIGVMSVFAQLERETITERLKSGRLKMVKDEGLWAGGAATTPYGYIRHERGELSVNEDERLHVKRIFEEYVSLKSYIKVQQKLEKEGFTPLPKHRILTLLKNRLYLGEVSFAGEWHKGSHEPLITEDLFNAVQNVIEQSDRKNFGKIKNNVFRHKLICGECGQTYLSYTNREKKSGNKYYYMMCRNRRITPLDGHKCTNRNLRRTDLEQEIFTRIMKLEAGDYQAPPKKKKPENIQPQIEKLDNKISKLIDLYLESGLSKENYEAKLAEYNQQKQDLITKSKESNYEETAIEKLIQDGIPNLFECDLETQTSIIDLLIDQIIVHSTDLEIIWKHQGFTSHHR